MDRSCLTIVLAAGNGTRMRSSLPKVLHKIANLPLICHILDSISYLKQSDIKLVLGDQAGKVEDIVKNHIANNRDKFMSIDVSFVEQEERLGTAHAVLTALNNIQKSYDDIIICFGDTPLIQPQDLEKARKILSNGSHVAVFGFNAHNPTGYGRLIIQDDKLIDIVEENEATLEQKQIKFCNGGVMALDGNIALKLLLEIENNNSKCEYYLTDLIKIANNNNYNVEAIEVESTSVMGVNTPFQLNDIENIWQNKKRIELLENGVLMQDAQSIYFSFDTVIEAGVQLETNIYFAPGCYIEAGACVKSFCHIEGSKIKTGAQVGPFARLRPGTILENNSKVGNFCEIKSAKIGAFSKVNHLSYIGNASVGFKTNIGAGVITCNYDGVNKSKTIIDENVFIGSNCSLVAPVNIGSGAYVASSSIVTYDVPKNALAIGRAKQINKENYALKIKEKINSIKEGK